MGFHVEYYSCATEYSVRSSQWLVQKKRKGDKAEKGRFHVTSISLVYPRDAVFASFARHAGVRSSFSIYLHSTSQMTRLPRVLIVSVSLKRHGIP